MPDLSVLNSLLDLQKLDTTIDQLRRSRDTLPEIAELTELGSRLKELDGEAAVLEAERSALRSQQRQLETDASDIESKAAGLEAKLYDGSVTSPKEATALGDEIAGLKERQSGLEERSIELLLEIEPLDEQLVTFEATRGEIEARSASVERRKDELQTEIDEGLNQRESERESASSHLDDELLGHYGQLRATFGASAVIPFDAGKGGGCPVAMPAVELDRWKHEPAGAMDLCGDCGRLIVKLD